MQDIHKKIADYILSHPETTYTAIARKLGVSPSTITDIAKKAGIPARKPRKRLTDADLAKLIDAE